jgi:hypothetical protein
MGDLSGARRRFVTGAVLFARGSLLASLATSTSMVVTGEAIIEGVGASLLFPARWHPCLRSFKGPPAPKPSRSGRVAGASAAPGARARR